jgi:glycosyltransferase involved in cell wall biosynthesis
MIRVGLVTTVASEHRCGIAEYARMLQEHLPPDIQITQIGGPYDKNRLLPRVRAGNFDIVHFNYESGFLGIFSPGVAREFGPRTVITLHDHWPVHNLETYPFTKEFSKVVVHQETNEGFVHIPHGIPVLTEAQKRPIQNSVGTAGFPLTHKGILLVALAAALLDKKEPDKWDCLMICPENPHVNTYIMQKQVMSIFPRANYITGWMAQDTVMEMLSQNRINIFPYRNGKPGISAAVRMGLATGSQMVLSRSTSFMDLWSVPEYEQEIEWIDGDPDDVTPNAVAQACYRVMGNGKKPKKILEDMSWTKAASQYAELYRSLM